MKRILFYIVCGLTLAACNDSENKSTSAGSSDTPHQTQTAEGEMAGYGLNPASATVETPPTNNLLPQDMRPPLS